MRQFIRENRAELDECIRAAVGCNDGEVGEKCFRRCNDEERRLWVLNDEGLYNWARSAGVPL